MEHGTMEIEIALSKLPTVTIHLNKKSYERRWAEAVLKVPEATLHQSSDMVQPKHNKQSQKWQDISWQMDQTHSVNFTDFTEASLEDIYK